MQGDLECQGIACEAVYKIRRWICARRIGHYPNLFPKVSRTRVKEPCQGETPGEIARWLVGEGECGPQWIVVARSFEIGSPAVSMMKNGRSYLVWLRARISLDLWP
jgi:hypothetical protein